MALKLSPLDRFNVFAEILANGLVRLERNQARSQNNNKQLIARNEKLKVHASALGIGVKAGKKILPVRSSGPEPSTTRPAGRR